MRTFSIVIELLVVLFWELDMMELLNKKISLLQLAFQIDTKVFIVNHNTKLYDTIEINRESKRKEDKHLKLKVKF